MKIVTCKNCGANYQLDDDDDISTYECSSCAGNLELIEEYPSENEGVKSTLFSEPVDEDDLIVECEDCGLKYRLNKKENILDYECDSCGGSLKYVDKDIKKESLKSNRQTKKNNRTKKSIIDEIPDKIENVFFDEEIKTEKPKTARTKIPNYILSKFEKDFDVSKVTNYDTLKDYLKKKFYMDIENEYLASNELKKRENITKKGFLDKISIKEPETESTKHELVPNPNEKKSSYHYLYIIIGIIIGIVGAIDVYLSNRWYGLIFIIIGLIIVIFGLYKTRDYGETEKRGKIIRQQLLTLPEEYYVLYYVKVPESSSGINHVVIGPSGIYSIVTQKYYTKENTELKSDKENNHIINTQEEHLHDISRKSNKFQYTVKKDKFESNNKIKQKSLKLGEDLINFLNENGFENYFVEPLVGFVNDDVAVINMPLTDEDLFLDELLKMIKESPTKLDTVTIHKFAVILSQYAAECSS